MLDGPKRSPRTQSSRFVEQQLPLIKDLLRSRLAADEAPTAADALRSDSALERLTGRLDRFLTEIDFPSEGSGDQLTSSDAWPLALRVLSDEALRIALPASVGSHDFSSLSHELQWTVLQRVGALGTRELLEPSAELRDGLSQIPFFHEPDPQLLRLKNLIEQQTGVPWHYLSAEDASAEGRPRMIAAADNEGFTRALLTALSSNHSSQAESTAEKPCYFRGQIASKTRAGASIPLDALEATASSLLSSPELSDFRGRVGSAKFVVSYTNFQHERHAAALSVSQMGTQGCYALYVREEAQVEPEALLAEELGALTGITCLPPQAHRPRAGYALMFEHEPSRDLAHEFLARFCREHSIGTLELPYAEKCHPYDSRFELHIPTGLAERAEFRELLRVSSELYEGLRNIRLQDLALFLPLDDEILNYRSQRTERRAKAAEKHVEQLAHYHHTSLTQGLREMVLRLLSESSNAKREIALHSLSAPALHQILAPHSLLYWREHGEQRLSLITELCLRTAEELRVLGEPVSSTAGDPALHVQADDAFMVLAMAYMDRLDASTSGGRFELMA